MVRSGEWIAVQGYVTEEGLPMRLAEVWLLINGKYVKCIPQTCWHERFWFNCRFGVGRYHLQAEAYKVMEERTSQTKEGLVKIKKEHRLKSDPISITVLPKVLNVNRMFPRSYEVENWRKVTLAEAIAIARKAKELILKRYPDTSRVMIVGGVVDRGWSRRDIDLLIVSPSLYEEYKVKGEPSLYRPRDSKETYQRIKTRSKDWRVLSFEKEVERYVAYPMTVLVIKDDRELQDSWGVDV
ncbi:hypothetical protein ES703_39095 [subsurface metagenome]